MAKKKKSKYSAPRTRWDWESVFGNFYDQLRTLHMFWTVLLAIGFAASFFLWGYFLYQSDASRTKILAVEGIVFGVLLLAHLYRIFFVGYDDRLWRNFKFVYVPAVILTLIGFYIAGVSLIGTPADAQQTGLFHAMQVFTNVFSAVVMAMIPSLILTILIWFLIQTVEFFTRP